MLTTYQFFSLGKKYHNIILAPFWKKNLYTLRFSHLIIFRWELGYVQLLCLVLANKPTSNSLSCGRSRADCWLPIAFLSYKFRYLPTTRLHYSTAIPLFHLTCFVVFGLVFFICSNLANYPQPTNLPSSITSYLHIHYPLHNSYSSFDQVAYTFITTSGFKWVFFSPLKNLEMSWFSPIVSPFIAEIIDLSTSLESVVGI